MKVIDTATYTPEGEDETSWVYNGLDSAITAEIYNWLILQLDATTAVTYEIERALQGPVLEMNLMGLQIDFHQYKKQKVLAEKTIARLEKSLNRLLAEGYDEPELNWQSPTQLKNLFYTKLQLPEQKARNSNGFYAAAVNRAALEKLEQHMIAAPVIKHILALRDISKKLSFIKTNISDDGRLRTSLNIAGTNTGRLASSMSDFGEGRNLQNVDRSLKACFIASRKRRLCNIDLEQADSRNMGATCWNSFYESHGEEFAGRYLNACEAGDLHTVVTQMVWPELDWESVGNPREIAEKIFYRDFSYRDMSKRAGHGTNYCALPPTMAINLHITKQIAADFQNKYFAAFPEIREVHKWVEAKLKQTGALTTIHGRRRMFFGRPNESATLREAVAYMGQSATGDEMNKGLIKMHREGSHWPGFRMLIQVHDSILFEYDEECENEIIPWAISCLEQPIDLAGGRPFYVPCEAKVGWNWGDADKENPDGLIKWKGTPDTRFRQKIPSYIPVQ